MAILKIYSDIVDEEEKTYLSWDGREGITFRDVADFIASIPEDDDTIDIHINCAGGDCVHGWAIYDALRLSGKTISAVIEGQCSSMATAILLAAPKERRTAYRNAHLCIHNPEACWLNSDYYERWTADNIDAVADQLKLQAESLRTEQQKLLDLYVERTSSTAEELQELMNENIFINMERALQMGFIGSILAPNTAHRHNNQNFISMSKQKKNEDSVIRRLLARLGFKTIDEVQFKDQIITAADGTEVTVEREEGDPQVGDTAYPDGTYVLDDGTAITVDGNVIATITPAASVEPQEPEPAPDPEPAPEPSADPGTALPTTEELQQEIQQLQITLAGKEAELKELEKTTDELKQQVTDSKAEAENAVRAMEEVRSQVKTEEESTILAKVQSMGGIKWLDTVSGMRSTYNVNNRRFVDHAPAGQQITESKTQKAKRELEEANEAKRKKRQAS